MRTSVAALGAAVVAIMFGAAGGAEAAITVSASVGGVPTGVTYENFDSLTPGSSSSATLASGIQISFNPDAKAVTGSQSGKYAAPYLSNSNGALFGDNTVSGPDTTVYVTSGSYGSSSGAKVTLLLPGLQQYFGLLWGSVDTYNTLRLLNGSTVVGTVTGDDITASANGNQGANGTYYANINSTLQFDRVEMTSNGYAFEFDNVAFNASQVPVPAALPLLGSALLGLAGMARRRRAVSPG